VGFCPLQSQIIKRHCKEHKVKFHQTNVGPVSGTSFLDQKDKLGGLKRTETVGLSQWFCHFRKVRVCLGLSWTNMIAMSLKKDGSLSVHFSRSRRKPFGEESTSSCLFRQ
jgi:hypothetical protein